MSAPSDFSDRPLVAGSLVGVRSWRVTRGGTITGLYVPATWHAGVNHAECMAGASMLGHLGTHFLRVMPPRSTHPGPIAALDCRCGFYGFFDREHHTDYIGDEPHVLTGLIRGTGGATVGSKGFRVQRAEVIAFVEPQGVRPFMPAEPERESLWDRLGHWLFHHSRTALTLILGMYAAAILTVLVLPDPWAWMWFGMASGSMAGLAHSRGRTVHRRRQRAAMPTIRSFFSPLTADMVEAVRRAYPGVPWFATLDEAVAAFPLSQQPAPIESGEQS